MDKYFDIFTHPFFAGLSPFALKELSALFLEYSCDEEAVLYYKNDGKGDFYFFLDGEFCAATADNKRKTFYFSGDYSDPKLLFDDTPYDETLMARTPGRYLKLSRDSLLSVIPSMKKGDVLMLSKMFHAESWISVKKRSKKTSGTRRWRKSGFFLFEQLQYPLIVLMLMVLMQTRGPDFPYDFLFYRASSVLILFYASVQLLLWLSELYSLDSRELSSRKFSLNPPELKKMTLPLDQICGMKVEKKKLKNRFLNVGNLHIQTAAGTVLLMENLDRPKLVEKEISRFLAIRESSRKVRDRLDMRKRMERHFEVPEDIHGYRIDAENKVNSSANGEILFRKSFMALFTSIWWQVLAIGTLSWILWLFRDSGGIYLILTFVPFLGIMFWRLQDWRNDLYKVSGGKIIDINRKPFGKSETSNLADIAFVTNVKAEKKGFFRYLFNYGDVEIETAGGKLCFETVADPISVQKNLLEQRQLWKEAGEEKMRDSQFRDFLVYSEIYKQAEEQNRLKRLTPPHRSGGKLGV